jgi:hypothetical protein
MRQVLNSFAARCETAAEATRIAASPPPGPQSGRGPAPGGTAPPPRRGQRGVEDLLRKQFLLAPRLRCLWSHPAGLRARGLIDGNKRVYPDSGASV